MDQPFRSAAFGGFHRQDVLDYLEQTATQTRSQLEQLSGQLASAQEENQRLTQQNQEREERITQLNRERDTLHRELDQARSALAQAKEREKELTGVVEQLEQEREELKGRMERLQHDADAFAAIKDRSAGVELEAHCRAQQVLDQAHRQAGQLRREVEQWLARVEQDYSALRSKVNGAVGHAAQELKRAEEAMGQIGRLLDDQGEVVETMARSCRSQEEDQEQA